RAGPVGPRHRRGRRPHRPGALARAGDAAPRPSGSLRLRRGRARELGDRPAGQRGSRAGRGHEPRGRRIPDRRHVSLRRPARRSPAVVLAAGYAAGAIPFSNIAARRARGVDLRAVGTGTVSGTALYRVAGFGPLALAGIFDVAKGAVGPVLAGRDRPVLAAAGGGLAVAGHNWSPFLAGAG